MFQGGLDDVSNFTAAERRVVCGRKCTYITLSPSDYIHTV